MFLEACESTFVQIHNNVIDPLSSHDAITLTARGPTSEDSDD